MLLGLVVFMVVAFVALSKAQNKEDYQWVFGYENGATAIENQSSYIFDYENEQYNFIDLDSLPIEFHGANASICDTNGKLLFYTNGCQVANKEHRVMPNGRDLNDGYLIDVIHGGDCDGYRSVNSLLILEDPKDHLGFYIIHKFVDIDSISGDIFSNSTLYSYVDMTLDSGLGDVTTKNIPFVEDTPLLNGFITAVKHSNKKDWWIIQPLEEEKGFLTILLNEDGFSYFNKDTIDPFFPRMSSSAGNAKFSPDGKKFAVYSPEVDLNIYNFNRSSGSFSNRKKILVDHSDGISGRGYIEFSPDSRFLYVNRVDSLFQVDLAAENEDEQIHLVGVWDGTNDPVPTAFFGMALAPDCKIYLKSGSGSRRYHIIHKPNEKGENCDFEQGVLLPQISPLRTIPNFPRYRVDMENNPCGKSYFTSTKDEKIIEEIVVFPNPSDGNLKIEFKAQWEGIIRLYSFDGELVFQQETNETFLELEKLPFSGIFLLEFTNVNGNRSNQKVLFH